MAEEPLHHLAVPRLLVEALHHVALLLRHSWSVPS